MSQKLQRTMERRQHGGLTSIKAKAGSGIVSSISFTPVQGIELIAPTPAEVKTGKSSTYFSK